MSNDPKSPYMRCIEKASSFALYHTELLVEHVTTLVIYFGYDGLYMCTIRDIDLQCNLVLYGNSKINNTAITVKVRPLRHRVVAAHCIRDLQNDCRCMSVVYIAHHLP